MVNNNDADSIQNMMGDYSHVGDESIQDSNEAAINLDNISDLLQGPNHRNTENHQARKSHHRDSVTDQQSIDDFPYVNTNDQEIRGNPHIDDETNRFLRPFGTTPQKDEDSFSAVMKQWNDEREAQERSKNESDSSAREVINDERKTVGLYHNVPGDFAETLIFYDPFTFNTIVDEYMETILSNVDNRSVDEWLEILRRFNEYHKNDGLIPKSHRVFLKKLEDGPFDYMTQSDWELLVKVEGFMYYEWSVYPDVRAITVPVNEENDENYETFRVYFIGIGWALAGCILDTMFEFRTSYSINECALQMLIAITGKLWALLPRIYVPLYKGRRLTINNGLAWSYREQMLATITMGVSLRYAFAENLIITLSNEYIVGQSGADNFGFIILLILSTQFMGFAIAGLQRAFFVYPSKMVYFDTLYVNALSRALVTVEPRERVNGWVLKRWEFFSFFAILFFGWYWVVEVAFTALRDFDWPTWIRPDNVNLNAITGTASGLGIFPISTFDPYLIKFEALYTPWNALWQYTAGFLVTTIAIIIVWYTNTANTGYLPINVPVMYDNTGNYYNKSRVINADNTLNLEAYEKYSMVFYGASYLVEKGVTFMYYPAQLLSCVLNYWPDFVNSSKSFKIVFKTKKSANVLDGFDDRFSRIARSHPEAPEWWYILIFFACFGVSIAVVEHWGFVGTPVYSIVLSCGIAIIFMYPMESLRARTTRYFSIKPLLLLINGIIFTDNPIGLMMSTLYGTAVSSQNDNYIDNLKVGHYAGLAPRSLFRTQVVSLLISSIVEAGFIQWLASGKFNRNFCNPTVANNLELICPITRGRYKDAIFQAAMSPNRIFHDYPYLKWAFLIGALYPLPLWLIRRLVSHMKSKPFFSKIVESDILVILDEMVWLNSGLAWFPLNSWQVIGSNFIVGVLWHKWIKPTYPQWFAKYTYLFYTSILVALSFGDLIYGIFMRKIEKLNLSWWGNNVNKETIDNQYTNRRLQIPQKGYFGPDIGNFPGKI